MNSSSAVFIDWFGTIADREMAPRRYAEVMGHVLHAWWGGSVEAGIAAHNTAFERELQKWPSRLRSVASYRTALRQSQADYTRILSNAYGRPFQGSDEEAVAFNERLFSTVAAQVDVTYPDVRPALQRLKQMGCRIFPASGAPRPLGAAEEAGCSCVLVDRGTATAEAPFPRIATLALLPDLVMTSR